MAPQNDKFRLLRRIPDLRFEEVPKGYSKEQVNRVLDNLAQLYEEIERLQARLAEAETRAASAEARLVEARSPSNSGSEAVPPLPNPDFDETLRNTLVSAQRTADTMLREAQDEATRVQNESELQSTGMLDDAREQAKEMTSEAVTHRNTLMAEAEQERIDLTVQFKDDLQERKAAIEAELEEAHEAERSSLLSQISELQGAHHLLQEDIKRFEAHLDSRREAIRTAISDLNAVVEDPDSLRSTAQPAAGEVKEVNEADYEKIGIESPELDALSAEAGSETAESSESMVSDEAVTETEANVEAKQETAPEVPPAGEMSSAAEVAPEVEIPSAEDTLTEPESEITEPAGKVPPTPPPNSEAQFDDDVTVEGAALTDVQPEAPKESDGKDAPQASGDPFLAELRRVTNEEPEAGDPITDFLEDESSSSNAGGWFGRRK